MPARAAGSSEPVDLWSESGPSLPGRLRGQVPYEALVLGIFDSKQRRVDQVLYAHGWGPARLAEWLTEGFDDRPWFRRSRRQGWATHENSAVEGGPFSDRRHLLSRALPASADHRRWWLLLLGRDDAPFTAEQSIVAGLLLRAWQVAFDFVEEEGMGRLLLGHDGVLIHADPETELRLHRFPEVLGQLLGLFHPVVEQRWPELSDEGLHDFVISLAGDACWVRFRRRAGIAGPGHWYVELRNLDPDDLLPIGPVEDDRIAVALGYLHDRFQQSPTLAQVSRAVHTSPYHFHRLFTRVVGLSPKHYLQQKQLQVGKWLLRASRLSIGKIAEQTGFASHGHFTTTFHRAIGVSPRQYRDGE